MLSGNLGAAGNSFICRAADDRGALLERVLAEYAPDMRLTRVETRNRVIQQRFRAREDRRGRNRLSSDRLYADVAACLVLMEPERAVALVRAAPGSNAETRLRGAMLGRARNCVGNARQVTVDPAQFRFYIADSVYSWFAAVRGRQSLLPPDPSPA